MKPVKSISSWPSAFLTNIKSADIEPGGRENEVSNAVRNPASPDSGDHTTCFSKPENSARSIRSFSVRKMNVAPATAACNDSVVNWICTCLLSHNLKSATPGKPKKVLISLFNIGKDLFEASTGRNTEKVDDVDNANRDSSGNVDNTLALMLIMNSA